MDNTNICECGHEIREKFKNGLKNGKTVKVRCVPTEYEHTNAGKELRAMKLCGYCGCTNPTPRKEKPKAAGRKPKAATAVDDGEMAA